MNAAAIEALRDFAHAQWMAATQGTVEDFQLANFERMCTAALNGEEWAVERLSAAYGYVTYGMPILADTDMLRIILAADVTSPDCH